MYGARSQLVCPQPGRIRKRLQRFYRNRLDVTLELLTPGDFLLDVGCGHGELAVRAATRFKRACGMDLIPHCVERAREIAKQSDVRNAEFIVCNADDEQWPYPNDMFDTVTCIALIAHILDPYHLLHECWRVIKPNGQLVLQSPNIAYIRHRLRLLLGKLPLTSCYDLGWDGGTLRYFTASSLKSLIVKSGFYVTEVLGSGMFARYRNWWPSLLCPDIILVARAIKPSPKDILDCRCEIADH